MNARDCFFEFKHKLPLNGDWIYPTPDPVSPQKSKDVATIYSDENAVLADIPIGPPGTSLALLAEADRLAKIAPESADKVRVKAQILLGTSSFIGAVVLGIVSFFLQHIVMLSGWISWPFMILFTLMLLQFGISLFRSVQAMTREQFVDITPLNLGEIIRQATNLELFQRQLAGTRIALGYKNQTFVNEKVNYLILGQTGFGYGLFYALILILLFVGASLLRTDGMIGGQPRALKLEDINTQLLSVSKTLQEHLNDTKTLSAGLASIQKELEQVNKNVDDLSKRIQDQGKAPHLRDKQIQKSRNTSLSKKR